MNLSELLEDSNKDLVIIYPGRFHPFHIGHGKVYKYLKQKYSNAQVFISTSGKVDGDRSPFTFEEKKKMMILAGVDSGDIVQCKSPYQSIEILERFDKDNTVVVFAVSEKDMAEEPRFDFSGGIKLKKNGEPAYMQKWNGLDSAETLATRGYIATTPTFKFKVLGKEINSASQIRNMIAQSDDTKLTQMLQDLYSITDVPQDIIDLFKSKVGNKETMNENWDEHSFCKFLQESINEENTMKNGILQTITEGKSPHKKGTKKYNAHMAAIHAESYDEEFDAKVKQVVESKLKNVAADIKDYVDDHKEHFDAYPMDVEVNGKIYDFDDYWKILDKVYPDAYDNQYAQEGVMGTIGQGIDNAVVGAGKLIKKGAKVAAPHLKKAAVSGAKKLSKIGSKNTSYDAKTGKTNTTYGMANARNEAVGEFAKPIYDLIDDLGGDNDAHEIVLNDMVRYLGSDTIKDFVTDFRRNNDLNHPGEDGDYGDDDKNFESVKEATHSDAKPIYDLVGSLGAGKIELAQNPIFHNLVRFLDADTIEKFVADFRKKLDNGESMNEDSSDSVFSIRKFKNAKDPSKDGLEITKTGGMGGTVIIKNQRELKDLLVALKGNVDNLKENYANEQHEQLEYIHHVLQECGDGNVDNAMVDQAIEYVEDIREQHFNADGSTKSESIKEEANEDSIDAIYSNDGKTITISDYQPEGMANAHKKFNLRKQIHRGENGKLITSPWGGYKVSFHGDAEDVKAYAKNHLGESVNEAGGEFAQPIYDLINDLGGDNDAHEIVLNDMVRYLGSDTIKDFVADFRRNNDLGESIEEAQVLAHGGKGQYKAVSDGGVVRIMHKGKEIASGDFDSGADGWFVSREDDKGQKFFSDAQDMVDFFVEQKVDEHVRDSSEQGFGGQERNFIHDLSMMYDGVKRDPAGLKYLGTSEMWDEGNILKDKGKLTTLMLWVKKNKDVVEKRFSRMFGTYSNKDENGKVTASDGNQILLNIIKKIGTVNENWKDVTPAGYGPDDYDDKDVAPEDHGGDLKKMQDTYKHNEDRNNHSENILMLAQAFGDRGEIKAVEGLLKIIKRQGYTTPEQSEMMYKAIHKKYYKQLFPETETEGNEFSGALAKAKIDGKKTFDVDGKTYKVKEALSKLLDSQKTNEAGIMHYSNAKGTPEYKEGQKAAKNGEPYDSNPYSGAEKLKWSKGHNEWRHANKRKKSEPNFGARGQFEGK